MEHIDETKGPHVRPNLPAMARRRTRGHLAMVYELGAALTSGWFLYMGTGDWKQGVGGALLMMFGGGLSRAGKWYADR
jgi:hypothetical protein